MVGGGPSLHPSMNCSTYKHMDTLDWNEGHPCLVQHISLCACSAIWDLTEGRSRSAQAFFADIYAEAKRAKPSPGHRALAALAAMGRLRRHYTLNIDGLAEAVGLSTWHLDINPAGAMPLCPFLPSSFFVWCPVSC